jgi:hypothetical protein
MIGITSGVILLLVGIALRSVIIPVRDHWRCVVYVTRVV